MKAKPVRLLLLSAALAVLVWSHPASSQAASCPAANCDVFVSECLSHQGSFSYEILDTCTPGPHTLFRLHCTPNGGGPYSDLCWDD